MALTGSEIILVQGVDAKGRPAATSEQTTTGAIAALASADSTSTVNTPITTAGNGTLTAAGLAGGVITRTGPSGAFTDTTATGAQIYAAIGSLINVSFFVSIKNSTNFPQTLAAGSNITLPTSIVNPANSVARYLVTVTSATAATFVHISTTLLTNNTAEAITTLSTVGAGTITAAGIAGGVTNRTGSQSSTPFTDTTATADLIIAAQPNAHIGVSWEFTYQNTTNATATLTGGTGVTVSSITSVPAGKSAKFLVTYTAASTITMVGFSSGSSTSASDQAIILAGSTSGTTTLVASATAASTTQTLPAVTGTVASTSGTNLFISDVKVCSAQTNSITTALANVTGLTAQALVAGATYRFRCVLPGTADATSGISYALKYTTATLTSIESTSIAYVSAASPTLKHVTSTTDASLLVDVAAAVTLAVIEGTMVVNAGGTVALQIGTHTGTTTCSCYLGATMEFVRTA